MDGLRIDRVFVNRIETVNSDESSAPDDQKVEIDSQEAGVSDPDQEKESPDK